MPTPPKKTAAAPQKITAWSFSRLNDYRKCAKYAFFKHVLRMKEPGNDAMARGASIGEEAEKFAKAKPRTKCPESLACFEEEFRELQKNIVSCELEWAFTKEWKPTGWFDDDAWCRVKTDCCYRVKKTDRLRVIDFKTGKERESHMEQLDLYALAGLLMEPDVEEVQVELWYLDLGVLRPDEPKIYTRADVPALKKKWEKETKPMLTDGRFQEKPNNGCRYCHFSKAKGGPCKF